MPRSVRPRLRAILALAAGTALAACAPRSAADRPAPDGTGAPVPYVDGFVPDSLLVRLSTSRGEIDVLLRAAWAPHGVQRAYEAFASGYYDGARFFRTIRAFVAQFGIAADTARSLAWRERAIPDDSVRQTNRRGTLVFAAGGPNTRTVQLFFNLRDNSRLDAFGFAPIGEIVRGLDALDALYTGYGDGATAPDQGRLGREGEPYLAAEFPLLDRIVSARVVRTWPAAPAAPAVSAAPSAVH
jgi:cyclophilin family peptidyl-prolyl cis-trans isomerase